MTHGLNWPVHPRCFPPMASQRLIATLGKVVILVLLFFVLHAVPQSQCQNPGAIECPVGDSAPATS